MVPSSFNLARLAPDNVPTTTACPYLPLVSQTQESTAFASAVISTS